MPSSILVRQPINSIHKFLAVVLQALHLTPGRRLSATVAQWLQTKLRNPATKDNVLSTLSDLLRPNPWSFSLSDLAQEIGCREDHEENVTWSLHTVMENLMNRLAWSMDGKVADMAHRHEVCITSKATTSGCTHNQVEDPEPRFAVSLYLGQLKQTSTAPIALHELQQRLSAVLQVDFTQLRFIYF